METQLKLDFSRQPQRDTGKRTKRITFTGSEDLQTFLSLLSTKMGTDVSNLCHKWVIEGLQRDIAGLLIPQPHLNKSLAEIIRQGFA